MLWYSDPQRSKKMIWKVFVLQMLEETSIFTWQCKVWFWQNFSKPITHQKCQTDVWCGNMNIKFYLDCLGSCLSIVIIKFNDVCPQKVCLITIYRNKAPLLNISCSQNKSIRNKNINFNFFKKGIISKYCLCLIYFFFYQKPFQLFLNTSPHITKLYKHG